MKRPVSVAVRALLRTYQLTISPWIGPACRFVPSCSEFAREAIDRHGAGRGLWLAMGRLARCHPLCAGGYDPVPDEVGSGFARPRRPHLRDKGRPAAPPAMRWSP